MKKHVWIASEYHEHSSAQHDAATKLLNQLSLKGNEQILDVGCGDGKITAEIAARVPSGSVLGIDASADMIDFAKKNFSKNNLLFRLQDAQTLDEHHRFDLIFSSFALQWLPDLNSFLQRAKNSLKTPGCLALTIPLGISSALEQAIDFLISDAQWLPYFKNFSPGWYFKAEKEVAKLLSDNHFSPVYFAVVEQNVIFPSRNDFESYVKPWLSYLRPLPSDLQPIFFKQLIDRYLLLEPLQNREVHFRFSRLDLIASNGTL